ncbi:hypothetical protein NL676_012557 [Syzygium grande]|nr:hypothetical protein NL676_012557 [Syzygium grande]
MLVLTQNSVQKPPLLLRAVPTGDATVNDFLQAHAGDRTGLPPPTSAGSFDRPRPNPLAFRNRPPDRHSRPSDPPPCRGMVPPMMAAAAAVVRSPSIGSFRGGGQRMLATRRHDRVEGLLDFSHVDRPVAMARGPSARIGLQPLS